MNIRSILINVLLAVSFVGHAAAADQVLTIIVPFPGGGGADMTIRAVQNRLSQELKQPVVVQNLVGAAGIVGTMAIKKADNNGMTIGVSVGSTIGTGQIFNKETPYDYATDFEYVGMLGQIPRGFFVSHNSKYRTINDVILDRNASKNFGVAGNSPDHVNAAIFNSVTNSNHQLIPYNANTNTMTMDLLGGRLDGVWQSLPAMNSCLQNKSCVLLAVAGSVRHPDHSDVPTFSELGFNKINAPSYYGVIAPKGVSIERLQTINRALNAALIDPDVMKKMIDLGVLVTPENLNNSKQLHFSAVGIAKSAKALIPQDKK
jgi:tripartite-type tricarboxylate transporter receptor subunit TctC